MRLLNTKDTKKLRLHEFFQDDIPKYAILSHRWEKEEVTLQDIGNKTFTRMAGFSKIEGCCKRAAEDGYDWVWIDTCCIDKSSSAELSEAINSMYQWYQDSSVCYAYLSDAQDIGDLKASKWFSRGWTLQELIAPRRVILFDRQWCKMGTKRDNAGEIFFITGIPEYILNGASPLFCNVAQRMSWASRRDTTRAEDMAYCLMGFFNVHMSPIYGEGSEKAFLRLQEEILKRSSDQTLFLWTTSHEPYNHGLLATSPKAFCIHYECFSWLDILKMPREGFNPYAAFIPASTTPGSRIFDRRTKSYIDESLVTTEPSSLGSTGVQISLLSCDEYHDLDVIHRSTKRVVVSLDVRVRYFEIRRDICLRLTEENTTEFSYSTKLDRLGALRRLEGSTPVVDIMPFRMERKRLSISQVHGRASGSLARFLFISACFEEAGKEALIFEAGGFSSVNSCVTEPFNCVGGAIIVEHACSKHDEDKKYVLVFGTRGRSDSWCALGLIHANHISDPSVEKLYVDLELLSTRFLNQMLCFLKCGHQFIAVIDFDIDNDLHYIIFEFGDEG